MLSILHNIQSRAVPVPQVSFPYEIESQVPVIPDLGIEIPAYSWALSNGNEETYSVCDGSMPLSTLRNGSPCSKGIQQGPQK